MFGLYLLLSSCIAAQTPRQGALDSLHSHHHSDSDLDAVQCHNAVYKINEKSGKPELVSGEESRSDPSRQYLPLPELSRSPGPPSEEKDPAASFNQPNFLSVENTFVSPALQKNYNSLFSKPNDPELSPAAAQNVATNTLIPPVPKNNKEKVSEDDKYSLDRLCRDAFHSFLCKPIKGPRKTPNGRIRPNAVLPPDVIAGLSSFQNEERARPDPPTTPSTTTFSTFKPIPSNQYNQRLPVSNKLPTKQVTITQPPTTSRPIDTPEFPSPSNTNSQFLKPQPSNEFPLTSAAQTNGYFYEKPLSPFPPQLGNPSNQNPQYVYNKPSTTSRPTTTQGYFYDRPNIPFPSNNVPQIALPSQSTVYKSVPPHDCDNHKSSKLPFVASPSYDNPSFVKQNSPSFQKPFFTPKQTYDQPTLPFPTNNVPRVSLFSQTTTAKPPTNEECDKQNPHYQNEFGSPTNQNTVTLNSDNNLSIFRFSSNNYQKTTSPPVITQHTKQLEECDKHKHQNNPITINPTNENPTFIKPFNDKPLSQLPTNSFPTFKSIPKTTVKPTEECDKHKSSDNPLFGSSSNESPTNIKPYFLKSNPPYPTNIYKRPSSPPKPTQKPTEDCDKKKSYGQPTFPASTNQQPVIFKPYKQPDLPKIPSSSNNIAQILAQPQQTKPVAVNPDTQEGYVYEKPAIPFPSPEGFPSDGNPVLSEKPTQQPFINPTTTPKPGGGGYVYDQPRIPFASNNIAQILSQPSPVPTSTPKIPCEHENHSSSEGKSSNQYSESSRPLNHYFGKPETSVLSEAVSANNQFPSGFIPLDPLKPNTKGYPNKNVFQGNKNNDYFFKSPQNPLPSPFTQPSPTKPSNEQPLSTNIQSSIALPSDNKSSLDAKPQNQVEVTIRPGYSYGKPEPPLDQNPIDNGYSYPRPINPFIR